MVSGRGRRGAIDVFLIVAILLIVIVGASTAGGRLGGVGKQINRGLDSVFGTEPSVCPFLQKGALSGMLGIESAKVGEVIYSNSEDEGRCSGTTVTKVRMHYDKDAETTLLDFGNATDYDDLCDGVRIDEIINPASQELLSGSMVSTSLPSHCDTNGDTTWICCDKYNGPCLASQEDDGTETTPKPNSGKFYSNLRYYMITEGLGFSSQAAKDAEFASFATQPMPPYICIIIFGILPFLVMYYLVQDLLAFVFVTSSTKKLIAVAMSAMGIVTGAFADVSYMLAKLTNISLSWSFLFLIFGTGLATIVITNLMGMTSAASAMHRSLNEAHYGFTMLRQFGQQLEQASGKR